MISILFTGCTNSGAGGDLTKTPSVESDVNETEADLTDTYPFTFTDDTGEEVEITEQPERIVSVIPSLTETIFSLGMEENVVGVSDYANFPKEVNDKEQVGGVIDFNVEKVVSLQPDLVIGEDRTGMAEERYKQLREAGIAVVILPPSDSFEEVYEVMNTLSQIVGAEKRAEQIINDMKNKVKEIENKVQEKATKDKTVLVEIDPELWTVGRGTFTHEMLDILGVTNAAYEIEGAAQISEEEAVHMNPDIIIMTYDVDEPLKTVAKRSTWEDITAVKEKQVFSVESDIVSRPGPRLVEGLEEFARVIHPDDLFGDE